VESVTAAAGVEVVIAMSRWREKERLEEPAAGRVLLQQERPDSGLRERIASAPDKRG
jgi:hypothetical protein